MTFYEIPILYLDHGQHHIHRVETCFSKEALKFLVGQKTVNEWIITAPFNTRKNHCYHLYKG